MQLTQIHDRSLFWLGTDTSIKSGGVKLFFFGPFTKKNWKKTETGICDKLNVW
jgi:hypothetical protein